MLYLPPSVRSQNTEDVSIKISYLMATTPWAITIDVFDSVFSNSKYCKSTIIENKSEVSMFISELRNLSDTIIIGNNNYGKENDTTTNMGCRSLVYPEMDTRGKIIITTHEGCKVFYYSLNLIWDSTGNKLYVMSEKLITMINNQFFPKETKKQGKVRKRKVTKDVPRDRLLSLRESWGCPPVLV